MPKVAILMGSKSDEEIMQFCEKYLQYFGVDYEKKVLSAHRNPIETIEFARNAESNGFKVIIAGAGMAAHLPGVIAANTTLPVIGVPLPASELNGVDALYSIVQMPPGIPVATVAIGKAGAINAAVLAVEILALQDEELKRKLEEFKKQGSKL
ncbi:5-(carboxyamino)imidazole ribonucleotide mutase [Candidatus Kryptonium thompsonii]|jgi:phosphoribosylaminoimidazole carboxylase PurE protein|uniref:N5-carboxyaminoimidazole ribonucleotide mutase n=1 Tax=Candidatus Kryptonium thompsonii TaxID=1633631 RepID=A0A0P1MSR5_9BACT|nr:5-(carboxyamino)imidazole ribonucleotide mutase [Candidatus Kryptonium thompsoni]CUS76451.1 5-(carboxyamino)imidazole ribonucleotide mutase [Candidatus Kryptonium thompsoni]CUS82934.1 5-(carboxyamino)imidazole ribonucleotide mutase [Candidatus Kryptonium thompsoni]CUS85737.1 5-(carboxyamino)imidazole ribonucleotide mutase [Candidatus Kryptonium thompsoni]CUS87569.1 5-(carboxyamino)imidazole ribonucleotide mutase [Candidatus Kryptonium thompsoni]CUS88167.1 5-(carboxyamino)imidazole ribonucle